jgi:hypothetical protein
MSTRGYKTLVAVVTLLTSLSTQAQFRHFNKMYNHKGWWDNAVGVVDLGNHYLVAGTTADLLSPDSSYYRSLWLYYLDSAGNKGIERVIHFGQYAVHMSNASVLHRTPDGNFLVFGGLTDTLLFKRRTMLMKIDSSLNILWTSLDSGLGHSEPFNLQISPDSGFWVCGQSSYNSLSQKDGFLAKFDKSGNHKWTKYYGDSRQDFFYSVLLRLDQLIISGETDDRPFLIRIDSTGVEQQKNYFNIQTNTGFFIKPTKDSNNYIAYGYNIESNNDVYGYVAKITWLADIIWFQKLRCERFSSFIEAYELPSGNIITIGRTDNINAFNGTTIGWAVKLTGNGQYLREKLYLYEDGRTNNLWGASFTSDGGIICVGTAQNDYEPSPYGQDAWVMKIDTNLCDTPGCSGIIIGTTADEEFKTNDVKVYPNPFNNDFEVDYHTGNLQGVTALRIYNLQGLLVKEVALGNVPEGSISINMATCSPGLYLVQLVNNGSILKTQKLLKQR